MLPLEQIDMTISAWVNTFGTPAEHFLRISLAAICGGLIGLEREIRGRQAGFRTNLLVCTGSALVMVVSIALALIAWPSHHTPGVQINVDPGRIAYGVMGGIGFLGAGTIIHDKGSIRGLTTAAAMWCVAAIGLSAGMGLYVTTILSTLVVLGALWLLNYVEKIIPQTQHRYVTVRVKWSPTCVDDTTLFFKTRDVTVGEVQIDRRDERPGFTQLTMHIYYTNAKHYNGLERELMASDTIDLLQTRELSQ
jgi:putative Mg2+ transporter-C (MgtC) family protein